MINTDTANTEAGAADLAATTAEPDPDRPIRLPDRHVACLSCGCPTPVSADESAITWARPIGRENRRSRPPEPEPLARCADCQRRADLAAALLDRHPAIPAKLGPDAAQHRTESALTALAVLGLPMPSPAMPGRELADLLRHLADLGARSRWLHRWAPVAAPDVARGTGNPPGRPFAHLTADHRAAVRTAYASVLRDRMARAHPARPVPPPPIPADELGSRGRPVIPVAGACLMCGRGSVPIAADRMAAEGADAVAREVWTLRRATSPAAVGGRPSPSALTGWTCPDCTDAIGKAGAFGPSAIEYAVAANLGAAHRWGFDRDRLTGPVVGWGAFAADAYRRGAPPPPPNDRPWQHLGDLSALRVALGATA